MGADVIQDNFARLNENNREDIFEKTEAMVFDVLKESLRPEFINRIDEVVMFQPLTEGNIRSIVELQLKGLEQVLSNQEIQLSATPQAIDYIASAGFDPQFGARPVKRVIQKKVLNALSKAILKREIEPNSKVMLDAFDDKLVFRSPTEKEEKAAA